MIQLPAYVFPGTTQIKKVMEKINKGPDILEDIITSLIKGFPDVFENRVSLIKSKGVESPPKEYWINLFDYSTFESKAYLIQQNGIIIEFDVKDSHSHQHLWKTGRLFDSALCGSGTNKRYSRRTIL